MTTVQSGSGPMVQLRNVPQSFLGNRLVSTSQGGVVIIYAAVCWASAPHPADKV